MQSRSVLLMSSRDVEGWAGGRASVSACGQARCGRRRGLPRRGPGAAGARRDVRRHERRRLGRGTLRQAIIDANARTPGARHDHLRVRRIGVDPPTSALPVITGPLTIDGTGSNGADRRRECGTRPSTGSTSASGHSAASSRTCPLTSWNARQRRRRSPSARARALTSRAAASAPTRPGLPVSGNYAGIQVFGAATIGGSGSGDGNMIAANTTGVYVTGHRGRAGQHDRLVRIGARKRHPGDPLAVVLDRESRSAEPAPARATRSPATAPGIKLGAPPRTSRSVATRSAATPAAESSSSRTAVTRRTTRAMPTPARTDCRTIRP